MLSVLNFSNLSLHLLSSFKSLNPCDSISDFTSTSVKYKTISVIPPMKNKNIIIFIRKNPPNIAGNIRNINIVIIPAISASRGSIPIVSADAYCFTFVSIFCKVLDCDTIS